ncbi:response regulator [Ectothiorhodospira lacustris]|uniref:response regulator n=1 Tax=Ectothiorhodospira lacustris TaxID=2899127 RepID=UPI001EE7D1C2|nr:response regulator [Ectothiorhodospira lacustris]MCG5500453.1 response regulator [Ectothiorhodospira lacustris]MCG5510012.1 response regulator [Ectothiorhodospira lacustris]MCG5521758.1 response regulator [Ectothiorhodospira lacustris]
MKRILVIDDAATVRLYHREILEQAGFAVTEAINGLEALEKLETEGHFDLYLVDINMPKLDGYGFLKALREKNMPQAPAIMISTESSPRDREGALIAGANLYMIKPIRPEQLLPQVRGLLGEGDSS